MLNLSLFSMFIVISLANIFAPGAGVVYAITTGIQGGLKGNFWCRIGLAVGILVLMTASVSGLGVIVANSPTIFTVLRFIGIAYLIYLGIKAWRAPATSLIADGAIPAHNGRRQFAEAFMLQITNPQPLVFFISLLPQFIDQKLAYIPQVVIMTVVYSFLVFAVMTIYTFAVARARTFFKSPQASLILRRTSAVFFFIIAALVIVTMIRGI
ncbi:translocator protein LysE family [Sutterella sp. CAG:351]|uniref:LysE family translocator n=1 Tax=Dakarella massiliensis TaxID=1506471 RepID=UPI00033E875D|nr:LysE family translocator [Dakarella massiliensis]CDE51698.1 translocator protein LysE family [Sutterella sp. CAG:351]